MPGRPEQRRRARRQPDERVTGGLGVVVGLGLDDHARRSPVRDDAADQVARDLEHRPGVERRALTAQRGAGLASSCSRTRAEGWSRPRRPSTRARRRRAAARRTRRRAAASAAASSSRLSSDSDLPCSIAARTSPATTPCASRNGRPRRTSRSATSVAARNSSAAAAASRSRLNVIEPSIPCGGGEAQLERVGRVEQMLLVLLHVLVVGQRQAVHHAVQRRRGARPPAAPWRAAARRRRGSSSAA